MQSDSPFGLTEAEVRMVAEEMYWSARDFAELCREEGIEEDSEDAYLDVRVQVTEGGRVFVHTGSAEYDRDHRGYWGAGLLFPRMELSDCVELARELLEEAAMHKAMSE